MSILRTCALLLALLAGTRLARAGVIVVNASGGGHHTDLPAAILAASDGDVLLVKAGTYSGFTIQNKAVDVVADSGTTPVITGSVTIRDLAATQTVTLTGLKVQPAASMTGTTPALYLFGNTGAVRLQGVDVRGFDRPGCSVTQGQRGLYVQTSSDVFVVRSSIRGGRGAQDFGYSGEGGEGLWTIQSSVALYDCSVTGGPGGDVDPGCGAFVYGYGGNGGDGFRSSDAAFFGSGCSIVGGDGGASGAPPPGTWTAPGCGGYGLYAYTAWTVPLRVLASQFAGGTPGVATTGGTCPPTQPIVTNGVPLVTLSGSAHRTSATRVVREQQTLRVDFEGVPGERVEVVFSEQGRHSYSDAWRGVLAVRTRSPGLVLQAGTLDANGRLTIAWPVPDLGAGVQEQRFFLQAAFVDASGATTLGPPGTVVLLDSAF